MQETWCGRSTRVHIPANGHDSVERVLGNGFGSSEADDVCELLRSWASTVSVQLRRFCCRPFPIPFSGNGTISIATWLLLRTITNAVAQATQRKRRGSAARAAFGFGAKRAAAAQSFSKATIPARFRGCGHRNFEGMRGAGRPERQTSGITGFILRRGVFGGGMWRGFVIQSNIAVIRLSWRLPRLFGRPE